MKSPNNIKNYSGFRTLARKAVARVIRGRAKMRAQDRIPNGGVCVGKKLVRQHRYLRDHGLPQILAGGLRDVRERLAVVGRDLVGTPALAPRERPSDVQLRGASHLETVGHRPPPSNSR